MSLDNGAVKYNLYIRGIGYPVDAVASFSCNSGYNRDGCAQTTCLVSGEWAHKKPMCNQGKIYHILSHLKLVNI